MTRSRRAAAALLSSLAVGACSSKGELDVKSYEAKVRRTEFGVAHVEASDWAGLGFGQGYAYAEDSVCELADQIAKVRSERASFLGAGAENENVDSDFGYLALDIQGHAERALAAQSSEARDLIEGYVAGVNAHLSSGHSLPAECAGAPWLRNISARDLMAHILDVALVGVTRVLITNIGRAAPPNVSEERAFSPAAAPFPRGVAASNAWGIGRARSEHGRGMLVGNPHFPWEGDLRLHESHLRIPGTLDVYGVTLGGVPGVLIGFNQHIAWTHTVSLAAQSVVYELTLDPEHATSYRYGSEYRGMTAKDYAVSVRTSDGTLREVRRSLYRSHYGPLVDAPLIGWSSLRAAAIKTTALSDYAAVEHYLRQGLARNLDEFRAVQAKAQGTQWANTVYADDAGNAFYLDAARVPLLAAEANAAHEAFLQRDVYAKLYAASDVVLLDGADPVFEWRQDGAGPEHDVSPFELAPQLERDDFVFNANESYWLTQPSAPLEGRTPPAGADAPLDYSFVYGAERSARSPRTRMNGRLLSDVSASGPSGEDALFSFDELKDAILSNRSLMAEELREGLVVRCKAADHVVINGGRVELADACESLAQWNGRYDPESGAGALLFRELLGQFSETELRDGGRLFAEPFDVNDPLGTPSGLAPAGDEDAVLQALGKSVLALRALGPLTEQSLAKQQHSWRRGEVVPVHGCLEQEGCTNVVRFSDQFNTSALPRNHRGKVLDAATGLAEDGYWVNHGTSFLLLVEFRAEGPHAEALLTYGQSSDPESPRFRDQLGLFWEKRLRAVRFDEADIAADPELTTSCIRRTRHGTLELTCP